MSVITISRQLGAGGDTIAAQVANALGYELIDKKIITEVAKKAGVTVEKALSLDEKYKPRTIEWLMSVINPKIGKILVSEERHLDAKSYVDYLRNVIIGISEKGNVLIVGRGSQFILHNFENVFQVRIIADDQFRIERVKNFYNISEAEAFDIIKKTDSARKSFVSNYLNADWENPKWYHMILNSSRLGIEQSVEIIVESVKRFSNRNEFIPGIKNRRQEDRRSGEERRKSERRSGEEIWSHRDSENAMISGRSLRSYSTKDRRKFERRVDDRRNFDSGEHKK
jgi:cytidylate kinase